MSVSAQKSFNESAQTASKRRRKPRPVFVRATEEEREQLERNAGDLTISAYVRSRCIGDTAEPHRTRSKRPVKDYEALCQALDLLGKSRLPSNVNQFAKAVNTGTLDLPEVTEEAILKAA
ncbi:MAG: hypothetical protein AAFP97_00900 [Pseudomonadota bacterium]